MGLKIPLAGIPNIEPHDPWELDRSFEINDSITWMEGIEDILNNRATESKVEWHKFKKVVFLL